MKMSKHVSLAVMAAAALTSTGANADTAGDLAAAAANLICGSGEVENCDSLTSRTGSVQIIPDPTKIFRAYTTEKINTFKIRYGSGETYVMTISKATDYTGPSATGACAAWESGQTPAAPVSGEVYTIMGDTLP